MRANSTTALLALFLLLCGWLGYWVYANTEWVEEKDATLYSARALRDPFLAADYFLAQLRQEKSGDKPARDNLQQQLAKLPVDGTVILTVPTSLLTDKQAAVLTQWLEDGGHLIVIAGENEKESPDPLLKSFGVSRHYESHWLQDIEKESRSGDDNDANKDDEKLSDRLRQFNKKVEEGKISLEDVDDIQGDKTDLRLEGSELPFTVMFNADYTLEQPHISGDAEAKDFPEPLYWAAHEERVHFLQFEHGEGLLTVVSDMDFWTSKEIGKFDHALVLRELTGEIHGVSLIADADMPALPKLLWQWARELIIAALVLLLCWAWRRARRFGPVADTQVQVRRSLREHILASAAYLWRGGYAESLLAATRQQVHRAALQHFPEYGAIESTQRCALLHSASGFGEDAIYRALFVAPGRHAAEFRDHVSLLQRLQQLLTSRPNSY